MSQVVHLVTNTVPAGTSFPPLVLDGNYIAAGAAKTLTVADNRAVVKLDTAADSAITLPAATGSGAKFLFVVTVLSTGTSHTIAAAPTTDTFIGLVLGTRTDSGNAVLGFPGITGGSNSNKITLNKTTTGSVNKGEWIQVEDIAAGLWLVTGVLSATGAAFATPFSHV
jgi:hypothetical protein